MSIPFVGRRFTPDGFRVYLKSIDFSSGWRGVAPVLHHTAAPSLAQRPSGLSDQHLQNLLDYYQNQLKWSGAPHLFIDDKPDGIIVFQRLDRRGVHAKSFNADCWGIEMLGDYDSESPTTGRGRVVLKNSAHAIAALLDLNGKGLDAIRFHRDDPQTSKTCPGRLVTKELVRSLVGGIGEVAPLPPHLHTPPPPSPPATPATPDKSSPFGWALSAWAWAEDNGLMEGNPHGPVDRQTLATVLHRYHLKAVQAKTTERSEQ